MVLLSLALFWCASIIALNNQIKKLNTKQQIQPFSSHEELLAPLREESDRIE